MSRSVYQPDDGVVVLADGDLAALLDLARGRAAWTPGHNGCAGLEAAGVVSGGRPDPRLEPTIAALVGGGPRLRLIRRSRGRMSVTDAAISPTGDAAAVVVRPPGSSAVHLHHTSPGGVSRRLARRTGVGDHLLAGPADSPTDLPADGLDWPTLRGAFETPVPSGWAERAERAELHELRWAPHPRSRAVTALALARLDGALAEVTPAATPGRYAFGPADTRAVWLRLCRLVSPAAPPGQVRWAEMRAAVSTTAAP